MKTSSHWIHMYNKEKQWIISFNNQTGPILVHIYPLFNNNLHVKYRSNLIRTFWVKIKNMKKKKSHVGLLHKIQGYQGHQNVSKCKPHHSGEICTTRGNNLKTSFSFMGQNVIFFYILGLFLGPWEGLQWSDWAYLAFQLSSHPYLCTCEIRKQSDKNFLSLNPKYEKIILFFHIWGGGGVLGGLYVKPRWTKISGQ